MSYSNKKEITDSQCIINKYMEYVLESDEYPNSVYKFCKESKIKEEVFYTFFGSMDTISKGVWNTFFSITIDAINTNESYGSLSSKDKMLTFFYTFFELLLLKRNYVLKVLHYHKAQLKDLTQLRALRNHIKGFAKELIEIDADQNPFNMRQSPVYIYSEETWEQFLSLLRIWVNDTSRGFEKTDIEIERSVHNIFNILETDILNDLLDFDKLLWKEKAMWN